MESEEELQKGKEVVLAGYGVSNAKTHAGAGRLRKTTVKVDSPRSSRSEMILDQSHGHGACHGDSGGPAFIATKKGMVLAGVTNRSYPATARDDCAHKVVYTKVTGYRNWIQKEQRSLEGQKELKVRLGRRHRLALHRLRNHPFRRDRRAYQNRT